MDYSFKMYDVDDDDDNNKNNNCLCAYFYALNKKTIAFRMTCVYASFLNYFLFIFFLVVIHFLKFFYLIFYKHFFSTFFTKNLGKHLRNIILSLLNFFYKCLTLFFPLFFLSFILENRHQGIKKTKLKYHKKFIHSENISALILWWLVMWDAFLLCFPQVFAYIGSENYTTYWSSFFFKSELNFYLCFENSHENNVIACRDVNQILILINIVSVVSIFTNCL